jgi:hypothetical protein
MLFEVLLIIVLLSLILLFIVMNFFKECPEKIIYRDKQFDSLAYMYSNNNLPSKLYAREFSESSPWIGGFRLGSGKTFLS